AAVSRRVVREVRAGARGLADCVRHAGSHDDSPSRSVACRIGAGACGVAVDLEVEVAAVACRVADLVHGEPGRRRVISRHDGQVDGGDVEQRGEAEDHARNYGEYTTGDEVTAH